MRSRVVIVRLLAAVISVGLCVLAGEVALRIVYRDGGARTIGGPGPRSFQYLMRDDGLRGRRDLGPRQPGVLRLMAVGDSITWGVGVHSWKRLWPELLARDLEADGSQVEMAVFAVPGNDMLEHLEAMEQWGPSVAPDVLFYQWYANDIEVVRNRPDNHRLWHNWSVHPWLQDVSYLYFFLDSRLSQWLPPPDRSYTDYFLEDFTPDRIEWVEFERVFHAFSVHAQRVAPRRIMLLYPQVPYRSRYPLEPIHARMRAMADSHVMQIPPAAWTVEGGSIAVAAGAPWKTALQVPADVAGPVVETPEYLFSPGEIDVEFTLYVDDRPGVDVFVGTCDLVDARTNEVIAQVPIHAVASDRFEKVAVRVELPGADPRPVRFRMTSTRDQAWSLGSLGARVDYGWTVVDLAEPLNQFDTHASLFDAHPNEAAHRVIADLALRALRSVSP